MGDDQIAKINRLIDDYGDACARRGGVPIAEMHRDPGTHVERGALFAALAAAERRAEEAESRMVVNGLRMLVRTPCLLHAGEHTAEECAAESRADALSARVEALREALGMASPTPVPDVLDKLAAAADHLLRDHDCDQHGWEGVSRCAALAREQAKALRAALAAPAASPTPTPGAE